MKDTKSLDQARREELVARTEMWRLISLLIVQLSNALKDELRRTRT